MADIFNNPVVPGIGFRKESGTGLGVASGSIHLVQDFSVSYQQNIQPLYEVGSCTVYLTQTPAVGTLTINTVVGAGGVKSLLTATVCKPEPVTISWDGGCGKSLTFTCLGCVPQSVQWQGQAQNAYIMNGVTLTFVSLEGNG